MGEPVRRPFRFGEWMLAALVATCCVPAARAGTREVETATFQRELKRLEYDLIHEGARQELDTIRSGRESQAPPPRVRVRAPTRSAGARGARAGLPGAPNSHAAAPRAARASGAHQAPARDRLEPGGAQGTGARPGPGPRARTDAPDNQPVNDRIGDIVAGSTQAEVSIAASGSHLVSAWNDAENQDGNLGFAWSADGGATWTDGGGLPLGASILRWISDPVVTVDERTGVFYASGMAIAAGNPAQDPRPRSAIGVLRGTFRDGALVWSPPIVARAARDTLPDKPWIVADSTSGNLYLSYTTFFRTGDFQVDQIEWQRCRDDNRTWEPPRILSSPHDLGLVQGSRPGVGPNGELYVTWLAVDTTLAAGGIDWLRFRASLDGGATFQDQESVASIYSNFASGAPGFNRGYGIEFPGLAVDRSSGPYRGRVYVTWNEGLDFFHDAPGDSNPRLEREPNDLASNATPFNVGETVRGAIDTGNDVDAFRFLAVRGTTVTLYLDSLATGLDAAMRILCSNGETRLAYSAPGMVGRVRVLVFTPPRSDRYFLVLSPVGGKTGGYRIRTGIVQHGQGRARDQRDVFVAWRDAHGGWSTPVRANADAPWFDDWLPELAVAADGRVYAAWYDWSDQTDVTCGGSSNIYLARSNDGGASWSTIGSMSDQQTNWTDVASIVAPNQGDYMSLFADAEHVTAAWTDGREGDPNVMMAQRDLTLDPPLHFNPAAAIASVSPNPSRGAFDVELALSGRAPARLELIDLGGRRVQSIPLGAIGAGRFTRRFQVDPRVKPGIYWLRLEEGAARVSVRKLAVVP